MNRLIRSFRLACQLLDSHISVPDSFPIIIILQSYVPCARPLFRVDPGSYQESVDSHRIVLAIARNLVRIPLARRFGVGLSGRLKRINRTCPPGWVFGFRVSDLDFVSTMNRLPGIVSRIGKTNEHTGIGDRLLLHEFSAQHKICELPPREPPQTHSTFCGSHSVGNDKSARTTLTPQLQRRRLEQAHVPLGIRDPGRRLLWFARMQGCHRQKKSQWKRVHTRMVASLSQLGNEKKSVEISGMSLETSAEAQCVPQQEGA